MNGSRMGGGRVSRKRDKRTGCHCQQSNDDELGEVREGEVD